MGGDGGGVGGEVVYGGGGCEYCSREKDGEEKVLEK